MRINLYDKTGIYINTEDYVCLPRIGEFVAFSANRHYVECKVLKVLHRCYFDVELTLDVLLDEC